MFSAVIISKNEAHIIGRVLDSLKGITDDIIVVDSGSTDGTQEICRNSGARVIEIKWKGYGDAKNSGNAEARHDWILSIDSDEVLTEKLRKSLLRVDLTDPTIVYRLRRRSLFSGKIMRFGLWRNDYPIRLFNRRHAEWSLDEVHERLAFGSRVKVMNLNGDLIHETAPDPVEYEEKLRKYARLHAEKNFRMGRRPGWFKLYFSPSFSFLRYYVFQLGFLDGWRGFRLCLLNSRYIHDKYWILKRLYGQNAGA